MATSPTTPAPWAPTVIANLRATCCSRVAAAVERPPERLIASGVLAVDAADEVAAAFARHGLREAERACWGEWAAVVLERA